MFSVAHQWTKEQNTFNKLIIILLKCIKNHDIKITNIKTEGRQIKSPKSANIRCR